MKRHSSHLRKLNEVRHFTVTDRGIIAMHIANATMRSRIERVCRLAGYEPPVICTPNELMEPDDADDADDAD